MHKLLTLCCLLLLAATAAAQPMAEGSVPPYVRNKFKGMHSGVAAQWSRAGKLYAATFKGKGGQKTVLLTGNGEWVSTSSTIPESKVALTARQYIREEIRKNKKLKIGPCQLVEGPTETFYDVSLLEGRRATIYRFDPTGKFVSTRAAE